jgi:hypothetical protein
VGEGAKVTASSWLSSVINQIIEFSNSVSGLASLVALVAAAIAYSLPLILPSPLRSMIGPWWAYGYFYQRGQDPIFYKEACAVSHYWLWPWALRITSIPLGADGKESGLRYRGFGWYRSIYVYFNCYEPIYDDTVFEVYRRVMDETHSDDLLFGVHVGKSYDETVFQASTVLMSKQELVQRDPNLSEAERLGQEEAEFQRISAAYAQHDEMRGLMLIK